MEIFLVDQNSVSPTNIPFLSSMPLSYFSTRDQSSVRSICQERRQLHIYFSCPHLPPTPSPTNSFFILLLLFSSSLMSNSLWLHGLQQARLPCPSPSPGACLNSCPLSRWCHPTTSSSVVPFSSYTQSCQASGCFPINRFFTSGGQSIGASASVLPMNIQGWFPLGLTGLISLLSKGLSRVNFIFLNIFLTAPDPRCCAWAASGGYSLVAVHGLPTAVASLAVGHRL